ncbi:MAG: hypothetical protein MK171_02105 [Pirellulales bacterium]|nr:hypothetical protein [Pirellulales bacterium]
MAPAYGVTAAQPAATGQGRDPYLQTHGNNNGAVSLEANSRVLLDCCTELGEKMEWIVVKGQHHA